MKIIHKDGFSEEERKTYRETIYNNILDSAQAILTAIWKIGLIYPDQVCHLPNLLAFQKYSALSS
jgi:hypothetical protein